MKYANEQSTVRTLIAKRYLFKEDKNYYTDSLLYQEQLEDGPKLKLLDSENDTDTELD